MFTSEKPKDRQPGNSGDHRSKEQHHSKTIELEGPNVLTCLDRSERCFWRHDALVQMGALSHRITPQLETCPS